MARSEGTGGGLGRIGVLGASGLVGGGFVAAAPGARRLGRAPGDDGFVDLDAELDPAAFVGIDTLVHAASVRDEDLREDRDRAWRRATEGSAGLCRAAAAAGVRRFVFVSTAHVYGPLVGQLDEQSPVAPVSEAGQAQAAAEREFAAHAERTGAAVLLVRPNAVFGTTFAPARFRRWSLVPFAFPRAALAGRIRVGNPGAVRNFVASTVVAEQALTEVAKVAPGACVALNPLGGDDLTMHAFAVLCAAAVTRRSGRPVEVESGEGSPVAPFRYGSLRVRRPEPGALSAFVDTFVAAGAGLTPAGALA